MTRTNAFNLCIFLFLIWTGLGTSGVRICAISITKRNWQRGPRKSPLYVIVFVEALAMVVNVQPYRFTFE